MITVIVGRILTVCIAIFFLFVIPSGVSAETFYVDPGGDDSNSGSESRPWRTIEEGVGELDPGDTLYIKEGVYRESIDFFEDGRSWDRPVKVLAYPGHKVIVRPDSGKHVFRIRWTKYLIIDGLILDGENVTLDALRINAGGRHIRIRNTEIKNSPGSGIFIENSRSDADDSDYNEFINLDVHDNGLGGVGHGVHIKTKNNIVENSRFYRNSGYGIYIEGQEDNNILKNNTQSENGMSFGSLLGDLDGDGDVDIFDYNIFVSEFRDPSNPSPADLDSNGVVDIFDYNIFVEGFNK